jgi:hypothetical protein
VAEIDLAQQAEVRENFPALKHRAFVERH